MEIRLETSLSGFFYLFECDDKVTVDRGFFIQEDFWRLCSLNVFLCAQVKGRITMSARKMFLTSFHQCTMFCNHFPRRVLMLRILWKFILLKRQNALGTRHLFGMFYLCKKYDVNKFITKFWTHWRHKTHPFFLLYFRWDRIFILTFLVRSVNKNELLTFLFLFPLKPLSSLLQRHITHSV